ncbi:hypothetical protein DFJ58DRAFT_735767 [Suillus subalutaceus]|uniref:uncharacterized protein n=1 Tax=Suillus subalutaceus TaxID=48586 RepID=UPI001B85F518|nr:uncharacterized protein DFJ58DRAFT_735767 [Suillus subalutaceus]KAG1834634.1 hypothetical protein DFJ58DRAFT_735767 [Suillus subalutaceus]
MLSRTAILASTGHPLFAKTLGYQCLKSPSPPPVPTSSQQEVAAILVPTPSPALPPPANVTRAPQPLHARSKEFISDDEDDEVPADQVIYVKSKVKTRPSTQPTIPQIEKPDATESLDSSTEDATAWPSVRIFGMQCERCIKDDIPCAVILGKKMGELRVGATTSGRGRLEKGQGHGSSRQEGPGFHPEEGASSPGQVTRSLKGPHEHPLHPGCISSPAGHQEGSATLPKIPQMRMQRVWMNPKLQRPQPTSSTPEHRHQLMAMSMPKMQHPLPNVAAPTPVIDN